MTNIDRLAEEIAQLRQIDAFDVLRSRNTLTLDARRKSGVLRQVFKDVVKVGASEHVLESLAIDDVMYVHWKKRGSTAQDEVVGEFYLQSALLFAGRIDIGEPFMSQNDYGIDLNTLRVFDYGAFEGGPIYAMLRMEGRTLGEEVIIFDKEQMFRTSLTYATYLQTLLLTRGFKLWQYLFCDGARPLPADVDSMARSLAFLRTTFPQDDFADLDSALGRMRK